MVDTTFTHLHQLDAAPTTLSSAAESMHRDEVLSWIVTAHHNIPRGGQISSRHRALTDGSQLPFGRRAARWLTYLRH
jgi:hypothetical protein